MASSTVDRRLGLTGNKAYKAPAHVATTGNIALSGEQSIDGVTTDESRVVVWQQTSAVDNGIWTSSTGAWTRAIDANTNQDLAKGKQAYVEGRLHTSSYEDKEGVKKYSTEIIADQVLFMSPKGEGGSRATGSDGPSKHYEDTSDTGGDNDIPF